ncbi:addiction module protein [Funiculus sociatus GB2-A5]|uniref:Addiction module protein n=1 Tax=Funiculus sociatus GB2-A5 TaxID=2933946 RepID=A0ABV0JSX8_9CYAN|nr:MULTISPECIES: addiction module protein [unclassified Trichocoleus]MBD1908141.1 addiction module protein [Trichocoleus sp. FACHB-832]MBD2062028.1 addiction module protein [Trichocoleus sp. FACHB-6]
MSSVPPIPIPPGFDQLSKEEQILYVQQLWDMIAAVPEEVPTPQWHLDLVRDRLNSYNPEQVVSWNEVKQQLLSKYRDC